MQVSSLSSKSCSLQLMQKIASELVSPFSVEKVMTDFTSEALEAAAKIAQEENNKDSFDPPDLLAVAAKSRQLKR